MRTHHLAACVAVLCAAAVVPVALGADAAPVAPAGPVAEATAARTITVRPQRVMRIESRFTPPAYPTVPYVFNRIVPLEARRWGASASRLACRVRGESGGRWWATNGQYQGVGQFAHETFYRGVSSIGARRVVMIQRRERLRRVRLIDVMADGTTRRRYGRQLRQTIEHRRVGVLPRNPPRRHAWVQVRIMARALVGRGRVNDSEWEVRC